MTTIAEILTSGLFVLSDQSASNDNAESPTVMKMEACFSLPAVKVEFLDEDDDLCERKTLFSVDTFEDCVQGILL